MFFRKNLKFFFVIIILLVIIFFSFRGADNPIKSTILRVSSPFLKFFRIFSGGAAGFFDFLGSIGDLKSENEKLVRQNQELLVENNKLKDIEKENQSLRENVGLLPRKKYDLEASFIVAQDPNGLGKYFIIDKGKNSGIANGMPAIIADGILVGKISEVYSNTSKVILITDPDSKINAEVQGSGAKGIARGEYGLGLMLDMISQTEVVNDGDTVITSGLGGEMPRSLTIGKIGKVAQSADRLFQQASVVPIADFSDLRFVFIIKNFQP